MKKNHAQNRGMTLLVSVLITAILLLVSFVVVNLALKELVISNSNRESQYAFYNADSGSECALYWDLKVSPSPFDPATPGNISCNGSVVTPTMVTGGNYATSTFTVNLLKGCATVTVVKDTNGQTTINSRGYNTCSVGAPRRYERAISISNPGTSVNLVANSSFETDTSGWSPVVMSINRNSNNNAPFGSYSVTTSFSGTSGAGFRYSLTGITNSRYTVSGYFKTSNTTCLLLFVYDTGAGQSSGSVAIPNTQGNWQLVNFTVTPSGPTGTAYIDAPRCNGSETLEVDGISLVKG